MFYGHGSYPFDSGEWTRVSCLKPLEAARRMRVEITRELKDAAKRGDIASALPLYNKTFAILGADGCVDVSASANCERGTRAIYHSNGSYMIIERR